MQPSEAELLTVANTARARARTRRVAAAGALIALGLALLIPSWPRVRASIIEHLVLPRYESAYGFRGGRVTIERENARHRLYAIVAVSAGGRFDRAGVLPGDLPSLTGLRQALSDAESGKAGAFTVVAQADWPSVAKERPIALDSWARPT